MQFIILGAGSGVPHLDLHHSSLMVQTSEGNILVDCGDGVVKQLLKNGFNGDFLDAIFITHYHPDHVAGVYMLLQMLYLEGRTKPLKLFLPERQAAFMDSLHMFYTFEQRFKFTLEVHEVEELELHFSNISVALSDHLVGYKDFIELHKLPNPMQSYSFAFEENDRKLVYTSDLTTFANLQSLFAGADVLIVDALHPKANLLISLLDTEIEHIILTHGISEDLDAWIKANPGNRFEFAAENTFIQA